MKECLKRGARKKSVMRKGEEQMLDSIESGIISSVVQEESRQHSEMKSGVGDNILDRGFGPGQRVGEEGLSDSTFVIKEHSQADDEKVILQVIDNTSRVGDWRQAIETAKTEVRQGSGRKGK